jgi:hypothetical protein
MFLSGRNALIEESFTKYITSALKVKENYSRITDFPPFAEKDELYMLFHLALFHPTLVLKYKYPSSHAMSPTFPFGSL